MLTGDKLDVPTKSTRGQLDISTEGLTYDTYDYAPKVDGQDVSSEWRDTGVALAMRRTGLDLGRAARTTSTLPAVEASRGLDSPPVAWGFGGFHHLADRWVRCAIAPRRNNLREARIGRPAPAAMAQGTFRRATAGAGTRAGGAAPRRSQRGDACRSRWHR